MRKKPSVRTFMDSEYIKGSETLHKSWPQHFRHILWSLWKKISPKNSVFGVSEIFRLFVNVLAPADKQSL